MRDLRNLGNKRLLLSDGTEVQFQYTYSPGCRLSHFLDNPDLLAVAKEFSPDIIISIIGGNDIVNEVNTRELHDRCREYYRFLRDQFPQAKIIASQVEARFYSLPNRHHSPLESEYNLRRKSFNTFLKRLKEKDGLLLIAGPGRLDSRSYYRDEVHLNLLGLQKFFRLLEGVLEFCLVQ